MRLPRIDRVCGALVAVAILAFTGASAARAQELRLAWDHCGDAGSSNKTFSCSTNAGSDTLVVSFLSTFNFPKLGRADFLMHVCFAADATPDWWRVFSSGDCRLGALTATAASLNDGCESIWDPASGSIQTTSLIIAAHYGFKFDVNVVAADTARARSLVAGQEFELVRLVLDHSRSAGAGACTGCDLGANIGADFVWFYTTDGQNLGTSGGAYVTWQDASLACRAYTPVKNRTWGQLKSLYR